MNKSVIRNIVNKAIDREYDFVGDEFNTLLDRDTTLSEENEEYSDKVKLIKDEILKILPKDKHCLIEDLQDSIILLMSIETRMFFKEGVRRGLAELNYLSEAMKEIVFL